jgi:hypothetical protein
MRRCSSRPSSEVLGFGVRGSGARRPGGSQAAPRGSPTRGLGFFTRVLLVAIRNSGYCLPRVVSTTQSNPEC